MYVTYILIGIMTTDDVGREYLKETNLMFMSGIMVAIAVEHCNLHKRIALNTILVIGTSARRLMLGVMLTTMFLSMWISNTATTAMMTPIVNAVLTELDRDEISKAAEEDGGRDEVETDYEDVVDSKKKKLEAGGGGGSDVESSATADSEDSSEDGAPSLKTNMRHMIFLSVAYAANTGGTGTLTGTGSNLAFKGQLSVMHPDIPVNFANWMMYAVPGMLLNVFICWVWLQVWFIDYGRNPLAVFKTWFNCRCVDNANVRRAVQKRLDGIGKMKFHEASVLFLFVSLVLLWFFRDPQFIKGWGNFVYIEYVV